MKGKILSVRLNMRELVKMEQVSRETGVSVGRLVKQALYTKLNNAFVSGKKFKINNSDTEYVYNVSDNKGYISGISGHVCNIDYIGRTKVTGYTFVLNKRVNVEINLKEVTFIK